MMKILELQPECQTIHSILPPLSSVYYHYFHSLLTAPTNTPSPEHCPDWGSNTDHSSFACLYESYHNTNQLIAL